MKHHSFNSSSRASTQSRIQSEIMISLFKTFRKSFRWINFQHEMVYEKIWIFGRICRRERFEFIFTSAFEKNEKRRGEKSIKCECIQIYMKNSRWSTVSKLLVSSSDKWEIINVFSSKCAHIVLMFAARIWQSLGSRLDLNTMAKEKADQ